MADVWAVIVTLAIFALLALVAKGAEKLAGSAMSVSREERCDR